MSFVFSVSVVHFVLLFVYFFSKISVELKVFSPVVIFLSNAQKQSPIYFTGTQNNKVNYIKNIYTYMYQFYMERVVIIGLFLEQLARIFLLFALKSHYDDDDEQIHII